LSTVAALIRARVMICSNLNIAKMMDNNINSYLFNLISITLTVLDGCRPIDPYSQISSIEFREERVSPIPGHGTT
jgi:hypothetical protein